MQCIDYQCFRKLGGVCWHSAMWQICKPLMIKCQSKSLIMNCHSKLVEKQFQILIGNQHFRFILDYQLLMLSDRQRKARSRLFNRARRNASKRQGESDADRQVKEKREGPAGKRWEERTIGAIVL